MPQPREEDFPVSSLEAPTAPPNANATIDPRDLERGTSQGRQIGYNSGISGSALESSFEFDPSLDLLGIAFPTEGPSDKIPGEVDSPSAWQ